MEPPRPARRAACEMWGVCKLPDAEWAHANEWETPITLGDHLDAAANRLEAADKRVKEMEERIKNAEVHADCMEAKALALEADIADLRNELCQRCGQYKRAHLGYCDGCRWKKGE